MFIICVMRNKLLGLFLWGKTLLSTNKFIIYSVDSK